MIKRITAALLALTLLFTAAACNKNPDENTTTTQPEVNIIQELPETDKKVAVLVAPESQYPEDYRAAKALESEYPGKVVVKEYADSRLLTPGDSKIITFSKEIAADASYGAIVYARATRYTSWSISQAKEAAKNINPNLKFVCIEPEESVYEIAEKADLVITADWNAATKDIVSQAKAHGAEHFVFFTINRHLFDNPLYGGVKAHIQKACEEEGINFILESALDSNGTEYDMSQAKKYLSESVARLIKNESITGKNVVLFSTDSAVQDTLVELTNKNGFIYISPSFPTAYNGIGDKYSVELPENINDTAAYIESLKSALLADAEANGRFSAYSYPLASTLLTGAVYCALDLIAAEEELTYPELAKKVVDRFTAIANNDNFTVGNYDPANTNNIYKAYYPSYTTIR